MEEKLSCLEAKVKSGEGDERLRLKVELVRRKVERFHFLMHLLSVSKNPGEFAACVRNFNRNGRKLREDSKGQNNEESPAEKIKESPSRDIERTPHSRANEESQSAEDVEKMQVKAECEEICISSPPVYIVHLYTYSVHCTVNCVQC